MESENNVIQSSDKTDSTIRPRCMGNNKDKWKPDTKRPRGRPRQWWKDRITKDASRLGVNDGKELAQDRDRWRQVVAAAMDLNGP